MSVEIIVADVLDGLSTLNDGSVQCVVTSPPYWGLRDYGVEGQIGLEPTFLEYVEKMVAVFREVRRVLRKDGTLWLNMGDCHHSGNRGGYRKDSHRWENSPLQSQSKGTHNVPDRAGAAMHLGWMSDRRRRAGSVRGFGDDGPSRRSKRA